MAVFHPQLKLKYLYYLLTYLHSIIKLKVKYSMIVSRYFISITLTRQRKREPFFLSLITKGIFNQ